MNGATTPNDAKLSLTVALLFRNERETLPASLSAIAAARAHILELVVVDDASTDGSLEVVRAHAGDLPPIREIVQPIQAGTFAAMTAALAAARGSHIHFAAADDITLPGFFERSLALLSAHPDAGLCSTRSRLLDNAGRDLGPFTTPCPRRESGYLPPAACRDALYALDSWFMGNTATFHRDALRRMGGFDPLLEGFSDAFACWSLALRQGACFDPAFLGAKRDIYAGMGSSLHADVTRSEAIWRHAQEKFSREFGPGFDPPLLTRLERRWRFNGRRYRLQQRLLPANAPAWQAPFRMALFLATRIGLAAVHKPFDMATLLRRRLNGG